MSAVKVFSVSGFLSRSVKGLVSICQRVFEWVCEWKCQRVCEKGCEKV